MSILDFVSQDDLDDLEDDPRQAFMQIVNLAQRSLSSKLQKLDQDQEDQWRAAEDVRHSFMNVVVATSKRFEIEPFCLMEVPRINDSLNFKQFKSDLDHFVTQLVLDNSEQKKRNSVSILPKSKEKIKNYINALRDCVQNANMDEKKRSALLNRLDDLEAELEKKRANMLLVAKLAFEVLAIPGGVWASYDIATKLMSNISQVVEEAHQADLANRPVAISRPVPALSAPRKEPVYRGGFADDLDDDVPF